MPIKLKRAEVPSITSNGKYWGEITEISTFQPKVGEEKLILQIRPHNFETENCYRKIEVWMDMDEELDQRVGSLLDALPKDCEENIENAINECVGIDVTINDKGGRSFVNVSTFFKVVSVEDDFDIEDADEEAEDADEFVQSDMIKTSSKKKSSRY